MKYEEWIKYEERQAKIDAANRKRWARQDRLRRAKRRLRKIMRWVKR